MSTSFPGAPRTLRAGLVILAPGGTQVARVIGLQYNPDALTRSFEVSAAGQTPTEALRLRAPPSETIRLEAELDATDALERPDENPTVVAHGLLADLAALEGLLYPARAQVEANQARARRGELEIVPMEAPLTLFVWSRQRILPIRVTELSVNEEAFAPDLTPIRAKVTLSMRVLTDDELGAEHPGGRIFATHHREKEALAARGLPGWLSMLGLGGLP